MIGRPKPLIGISAHSERVRSGRWKADSIGIARRYLDRVAQAGGLPVLLPAPW